MRLDFLQQAGAAYIEELYERYRRDPESVGEDWQLLFAGYELAGGNGRIHAGRGGAKTPTAAGAEPTIGVFDLIHSYRELGHLVANLDPLGNNQTDHPLLELAEFGFHQGDLDRTVECPSFGGASQASLRDLVAQLRATYCGTLGVDYMFISSKRQRQWLQDRIEPTRNRPDLDADDQKRILTSLVTSNGFEQFLHSKFLGQKRFSIEGAEALVPLLETLIEEAGNRGVRELVMGMPHRGRLNVMANVLGKPYDVIFAEFEGSFLPTNVQGDGDVKYHLGYAHDHVTKLGQKLHVSLLFNPSHLEAVDPIVEGIVHAKQHYMADTHRSRVMPLLLHGDAAFTGQGIVMETLALSELASYHNGGTIHILINNQIGFTTSPSEARFTRYPSDMAKVINAPVFHVNADDPEAAVQAARLAVGFRDEFKEDVIIDLVCYRKHGHNELDDPTFTQPVMYRTIHAKRPVHELYGERLVEQGVIATADLERISTEVRARFDKALEYARDVMPKQKVFAFGGAWEGMGWAGEDWSAQTSVEREVLETIAQSAAKIPPSFHCHPKVKKLLDGRREMLTGEGSIDWACAEMLAFGTLLKEGVHVRLSGQDSQRGTFSQRHAVLHDMDTDDRYVPLNAIGGGQGRFTVIDSMLSEEGVLGFEYGFSMADPRNLVLWEAQYGDFANGAQVIIDQFISSAESKWQRQSGIVLLLPHGYEGQGPEHSSARLERFLQLCADGNMQVVYPSTPAQYFHVLRRQMRRSFRKPLVVMAPKSMLRNKLAVSKVSELTDDGFRSVIDETEPDIDPDKVDRVLLCSGKVYYSLLVGRTERVLDNVAIVRVEQLYPFPEAELSAVLERYPRDARIVWVQEEARNMGAWQYMAPRVRRLGAVARGVRYAGRDEAASPATGSYKIHEDELAQLLNRALRRRRRAHNEASEADGG